MSEPKLSPDAEVFGRAFDEHAGAMHFNPSSWLDIPSTEVGVAAVRKHVEEEVNRRWAFYQERMHERHQIYIRSREKEVRDLQKASAKKSRQLRKLRSLLKPVKLDENFVKRLALVAFNAKNDTRQEKFLSEEAEEMWEYVIRSVLRELPPPMLALLDALQKEGKKIEEAHAKMVPKHESKGPATDDDLLRAYEADPRESVYLSGLRAVYDLGRRHGREEGVQERSVLAAGQCVHKDGILMGEHGHPLCPVKGTPDASDPR